MLPILIGGAAAVLGVLGLAIGLDNAMSVSDYKDIVDYDKEMHADDLKRFRKIRADAQRQLDSLGVLELQVLQEFGPTLDLLEGIKGRPDRQKCAEDGTQAYRPAELREASLGARAILAEADGAAPGMLGLLALGGAACAAGAACYRRPGASAEAAALAASGKTGDCLAGNGAGALEVSDAPDVGDLLLDVCLTDFTVRDIGERVSEYDQEVEEAREKMKQAGEALQALLVSLADFRKIIERFADIYHRDRNRLHMMIYEGRKTDWLSFTEEERAMVEELEEIMQAIFRIMRGRLLLPATEEEPWPRVDGTVMSAVRRESVRLLVKA